MNVVRYETSDVRAVHTEIIHRRISELIIHMRSEVEHADEPRYQVLLETSAEVLGSLQTAFEHYDRHRETAWRQNEVSPRKPRQRKR